MGKSPRGEILRGSFPRGETPRGRILRMHASKGQISLKWKNPQTGLEVYQ